jgi:hypothetical protein
MARIAVCLDAQPLTDGTCAETAWIEQTTISDYLPTFEEGNAIGLAFFGTLVVIAAVKHFFKPPK